MKMAETHLEKPIARPEAEVCSPAYTEAFESYNVQEACNVIWKKIGELDEYIATTEPFKLVKTDKEKALPIIEHLVCEIYSIGRMLNPILPQTSTIIKESALANKKPENLFNRIPLDGGKFEISGASLTIS
jgi:methionyl-tRNA synthetase